MPGTALRVQDIAQLKDLEWAGRKQHRRHPIRVVVPSSVMLTAQTLAGVMRKLATEEIEWMVDVLITELDCRSGESDFENEIDEESGLETEGYDWPTTPNHRSFGSDSP